MMADDDVSTERRITAKISSAMQVIAAVPTFDGRGSDLEYFIRRMDVIVQQLDRDPMDEVAIKYVLGYFYSRISMDVLREIGVTWDTTWDQAKTLLRAKYGGASKSLPRVVLREVLMDREAMQSSGDFAKAVRDGIRKAKGRMQDMGYSAEELRIRSNVLEELAWESIVSHVPRRVKQWIAIRQPTTFEGLIEAVLEEEQEDRDERSRPSPKRLVGRSDRGSWREEPPRPRPRGADEWQSAPVRRQTRRPERPGRGRGDRDGERRQRRVPAPRPARQCWECREEGHLARDCPYLYRRDRRETRRPIYEEPMEVNATRRLRTRARSGSETDSSSSGSTTERSGMDRRSWADRVKERGERTSPTEKPPSRQDRT